MTTLKVNDLRDLIISGMCEARAKIAEDFERATWIERKIYTDDDRETMTEQLAQYDAFIREPDRWFKALARSVTNEAKRADSAKL